MLQSPFGHTIFNQAGLEWKDKENLAAKLWRVEKENKKLPPPSRMMSNLQYKKALKKAVKSESRNEMRTQMMQSSKLTLLTR